MRNSAIRTLLLASSLAAAAPLFADAEGDLRAHWQGSIVLLRTPTRSECTDHFTDNAVSGGRVVKGEGLGFAAGEIANVDKIEVTWTRIDVSLTLLEPFRVTWKDGPYTLYDQRRCRVQLNLEVPREVRKDSAKAIAAVAELLDPFASAAAARHAAAYNRRQVEPYPADWDRTRAEYEAWHAARINAAVHDRIETLSAEGQAMLDRARDDGDYLRCFGKGARSRSYQTFGSCPAVLDSYFIASGSCENQRGFEDGQHLAWAIGMVRALNACTVPAPPPAH